MTATATATPKIHYDNLLNKRGLGRHLPLPDVAGLKLRPGTTEFENARIEIETAHCATRSALIDERAVVAEELSKVLPPLRAAEASARREWEAAVQALQAAETSVRAASDAVRNAEQGPGRRIAAIDHELEHGAHPRLRLVINEILQFMSDINGVHTSIEQRREAMGACNSVVERLRQMQHEAMAPDDVNEEIDQLLQSVPSLGLQ